MIKEIDTTETKFGADEDRMMYFFLLSSLRKENYTAVGIDKECDYLKDEEKMNVIANLTAKARKAVIRRDFLIANFKDCLLGTMAREILHSCLTLQKTYARRVGKHHKQV